MKVLVADDEPGLRSFISSVLQEEGHEVVTANDSRRTVQMLSDGRPDLLILDMMMPGWDGREIVRHMDHELGLKDLPLILLKPVGHQHWLPEDHAPAHVLAKPFDLSGLIDSVKRVPGGSPAS